MHIVHLERPWQVTVRLIRTVGFLLAAASGLMQSAFGTDDVVLKWNQAVLDSIRAERTPPPAASRALAMTHIAIYDALNQIEGQHRPYSFNFPAINPGNASPDVSASTAAYLVLCHLYPARRPIFHTLWRESFKPGDGAVRNAAGVVWGGFIGRLVISYRRADRSSLVVPYTPLSACGKWQPTFPAYAPALLPNWGRVKPFGITFVTAFRAVQPPKFSSREFADAYREVQSLGSVNSTVRTADQTQIAYFWESGAGSVTPPGQWQVITQSLSRQFGLNRIQNARLFALLSIAQADAAISSWDSKYAYNYFRPITGIRHKCFNRNDLIQDASWTPLLPTPPFPAYTSGHSTFSAASARILALYFGTDNIPFSAPSPDPERWPLVLTGVTRSWSSFSEAAEEAGMSRIYGGIHWQFDNTAGLKAGERIADQVVDIHLRPRK